MLRRASALLAINDTAQARRLLQNAANDSQAEPDEVLAAAQMLAELSSGADAAADAYFRAFSKGLRREEWPAVIAALERTGRQVEASRLRHLLLEHDRKAP